MKYYLHFILCFTLFVACSDKIKTHNQFTIDRENTKPALLAQSQNVEDDDDFDDFGDDLESEFEENEAEQASDPLEGYNRFMTSINDKIYIYAFDPLRNGYIYVMPKLARKGINNFFHNLLFPLRLASNIFQAKFENSAIETSRFIINTTIGIFGIFDPAQAWFDLEIKDEDIGQALGYWGIGAGPHLVLPVLGPSNLRDTLSLVPEGDFDILNLIDPAEARYGNMLLRIVTRSSLDNYSYTDLSKGQLDLYLFLKNAYEFNRNKKIKE